MNSRAAPVLALIVMSILWGYGWVALKIGLLDAEPFKFTALRMSLSAVCLLLMLRLSGRPLRPRRLPELIKLGLVQTSALFTLSTWAVHEGSAGRVAFLVYTMPFFTLLFAWPMLGERVRGIQWLSIIFALIGMAAIIQPWHLHGSLLSNILAVSAGVVWGLAAIMVKQLQQREPMDLIAMTAWQMALGSIPLIAFSYWIPEAPIVWSMRFIGILFLVSVVITACGWLLWVYALDKLQAGVAGMATLAAPPIAMLASAYHFGERPSTLETIGMGFIIAALMALSVGAIRGMQKAES